MNDIRACTLNKEGVVIAKENDKNEPFLGRKLEKLLKKHYVINIVINYTQVQN